MTRKAVNRLIGLLVLFGLLFFVIWPFLSGFFRINGVSLDPRNLPTAMRQAGQNLAIASTDVPPVSGNDANNVEVRATSVSTDIAPIATPVVASDFVSDADALAILAEIDQLHKLSREGASYTDFRYEVVSGSNAASAIMATESGVLTSMRIACDDVCSAIYFVSGDNVTDIRSSFDVYVPEAAKSSFYTEWQPFSAVTNWDNSVMLGAQSSDILTQWVSVDLNIEMGIGDKIVIFSHDDVDLMVNTGVFASWNWAPSVAQ